MARRGRRDRSKEWHWRRVLRRWRRSGQAVRSYCVEHGLSEPSFYAWRRIIEERDRQVVRQSQQQRQVRAAKATAALPGPGGGLPAFVPVTITGAASLEVVLGDGRVVRVPPGFDAATLRQVLAILQEAPPC